MGMITKSVIVNQEGMFTEGLRPPNNPRYADYGQFTLSIAGIFNALITLQRSFDAGESWKDVDSLTKEVEKNYEDFTEGIVYRAGVKEGDFTSGSATITLAK